MPDRSTQKYHPLADNGRGDALEIELLTDARIRSVPICPIWDIDLR